MNPTDNIPPSPNFINFLWTYVRSHPTCFVTLHVMHINKPTNENTYKQQSHFEDFVIHNKICEKGQKNAYTHTHTYQMCVRTNKTKYIVHEHQFSNQKFIAKARCVCTWFQLSSWNFLSLASFLPNFQLPSFLWFLLRTNKKKANNHFN